MIEPEIAPVAASDEAADAPRAEAATARRHDERWQARMDLRKHQAETARLKVLADFLARPIHAHGGADPDPDIVTAYNLAVEAALRGIRRGACGEMWPEASSETSPS